MTEEEYINVSNFKALSEVVRTLDIIILPEANDSFNFARDIIADICAECGRGFKIESQPQEPIVQKENKPC